MINIITRRGSEISGANLVARGGTVRQYGAGGGGLVMGGGTEKAEVMVAADASAQNRSGLVLAPSSPIQTRSAADIASRGPSAGDMSRPKSVLAQASIGSPTERGKLSLLASVQAPDVAGEFQDYAPLTHGTRLSMVNQTYRLSYDLTLNEKVSLRAFGTWFDSSPASNDRLDLNLDSRVLKRNFGANGFELGLEGQYAPLTNLSFTLGTDYVSENQRLLTYDQLILQDIYGADGSILRANGTVIPDGSAGRTKEFLNVGAYAQGMWDATSSLSVTVGARVDRHNIYGFQFNPRVGVVYAPERKPYHLKALFGTSFKAPSAEQLYTTPMRAFDIRGNSSLGAQRAQTAELAGGWQFSNRAELSANLFFTRIQGRVEFVQAGLYQTASNLRDESYAGGELEGRARFGPMLQTRLGVGVAKSIASSQRGLALSGVQVTQPLYPVLQSHLIADFNIPVIEVKVSPEISYVGARSASQSNALAYGKVYELPQYVLTSVSVSSGPRHFFGDRETRITLRATNLLNTQYGDPGFNGVDVPALGRTVFLTWNQQL